MKLSNAQWKKKLDNIGVKNKRININTNPVFSYQAKQKRLDLCRFDKLKFIETYSISNYKVHFNPVHIRMNEVWNKEGIWAFPDFRGCAKTWFARWGMLHGISYGTRQMQNAGIMSEHLKLGDKHLFALNAIMTNQNYELLQYDHDFNIHRYAASKGILSVNDSMIQAFSYDASARGEATGGDDGFGRLSWGLVEDLEDFAATRNALLSRRKFEAVKSDFYLAIDDTDVRTVVWLGNYIRERCAIGLYVKEQPKKCFIFPIWDLETHEPTWPEKGYTKEKIEAIREQVGRMVFQYDMECRPIKGEGMYQDYKFDLITPNVLPYNQFGAYDYDKVIMYMDPASDKKQCLKSVACIGKTKDGFYHLLGFILTDKENAELLERCYDMILAFNPDAFYVENNGEQWEKWLKGDFEMMSEHKRLAFKLHFIRNDANKISRIATQIQKKIITRNFKVLQSITNTVDWELLESEFYEFPSFVDHIDGLDAIAGALEFIELFTSFHENYVPTPETGFGYKGEGYNGYYDEN